MSWIFYKTEERRRLAGQLWESLKSMPLLSMGFGLYWMEITLTLYSPFLFQGSADGFDSFFPVEAASALSSVVVYLVAAIAFRMFDKVDSSRWFFSLTALLMVLGSFSYFVSFSGLCPQDIVLQCYTAGSVLLGTGTALVCLELARIFAHIGPRRVLFHGAFALFGGSAGALVIALLPQVVSGIVFVMAPIPMLVCMKKCRNCIPKSRVLGYGCSAKRHIPWKFLVTSILQGFALGVMHDLLAQSVPVVASVFGFCAAAILLAVTAVMLMQDFNTLFYKVGFPLMAAGFFVLGLFGGQVGSGVLLDAGYGYQYLISCCLCAYLARRFEQSPVWIVGISTGCLISGQLFGMLFSSIFSDVGRASSVMAFILVVSALYLISSSNVGSGWGVVRPGRELKRDLVEEACLALATEHGLSKREQDVAVMLAKGKMRRDISEALHISEETVKTHTGRIYQKFAVHSKRDLMLLVEERAGSLSSGEDFSF